MKSTFYQTVLDISNEEPNNSYFGEYVRALLKSIEELQTPTKGVPQMQLDEIDMVVERGRD
tara:strand:- start:263 stop:445 length:183 start_codon:yes stop_codon:yes gene_type:complete